MLKDLRLDDTAPWKQRFRVPKLYSALVAAANPTRGLLIGSLQTDVFQLYAWDVPHGTFRPLTEHPGGLWESWLDPLGRHLYYLADEQGNELGHIAQVPFDGGPPRDLTPDMSPYTLRGFDISHQGNLLAFNPVNKDGFRLYTVELDETGQPGERRRIYHTEQEAWQSILAHNGQLAAMQSSERAGGTRRYSTLVFDTTSGKLVGELWDGPEHSVEPFAFSPLAGDARLLATSTRLEFKRPLIWDPRTDQRLDLELRELEGEVYPLDWSPDGKRLLLSQFTRAAQRLYLYHLDDHSLVPLDHPSGTFIRQVFFAPGGELWARWQDATHPPQVVALDGQTGVKRAVVLAPGQAPPSRPWQSITFSSSDGQKVQGWLGLPEGKGPFPTILEMHGGPHMATIEFFDPTSQAWLDHGFAYLTINYRGSTTFGRGFQQKIWGDLGHWELEDMAAARDWLINEGIAQPEAILLHGWSYGGYLTLLGLGKQPELWAGGLAGVALADLALAYEGATEALKAALRAWMEGKPEDKPEQYAASSPLTYAEQVQAPVFIIQGRNDTRTPARQVEVYEAKLKSLGKEIEVFWYDTGHMESVTSTKVGIHHQELMLRAAYRILEQLAG